LIRHGGGHPAPADSQEAGKQFEIVLWSSPLGFIQEAAPRELFGIPVGHVDAAFAPSGAGLPVADSAGFLIAELVEETLFVHFDLMRNGTLQEALTFARLLRAVANAYRNRARGVEEGLPQARAQYVSACLDLVVPLTTGGANCDREAMASRQAELHALLCRARSEEQELFRFEAAPDGELGQEFDRLLELASVIDVKVSDGVLTVTTDLIYCRNPITNIMLEIGAFDILIPTEGGEIRWFNRTRRVTGYKEGMNAPHVFPEGNACLGNVKDLMPRLIAQRDFASVVQVAIAFVESVNVDDHAGKHIGNWPVAKP
jgi:hypothetical protein